MSLQDSKKNYFWKIDTDFFDKHFVKLMLSQKNGEKILMLFIKLMCEACVHGGRLRYSKDVPYSVDDLKAITNSGKDFGASRGYLLDKRLVIEEEDGTFYLPYAAQTTGNETNRTRRARVQNECKSGAKVVQNLHSNGAKSAQDTDTDTDTDTELDTDIEQQTSGYSMALYERLSEDEILKLHKEFERSLALIEEADEDARIKGKTIKHPYTYIRGYARNKEWATK